MKIKTFKIFGLMICIGKPYKNSVKSDLPAFYCIPSSNRYETIQIFSPNGEKMHFIKEATLTFLPNDLPSCHVDFLVKIINSEKELPNA